MFDVPQDVTRIIDTLTENGYEAYAVGGCVRDSIIQRVPGDWDITTSALPLEVKGLFRRTVDTGIKHGTVTIMLGNNGYEVTTYRVDGDYEDGRHPSTVEFTRSLKEDLARRDFTINAMAYNEKDGIVDIFGGMKDLETGTIRCVGKALDRFSEDALRMLRAIRFSAQLSFEIEKETLEAIGELCETIQKISKERIHTELCKILLSDNPDYVFLAKKTGLSKYFLSMLDDMDEKQEAFVTEFLKALPKTLFMKYAALLIYAGPQEAGKTLKELKLDNDTTGNTVNLLKLHGTLTNPALYEVRKILSQNSIETVRAAIIFDGIFYSLLKDQKALSILKSWEKACDKVLSDGDCISIKQLEINGEDLRKLGMKDGPLMGECLKAMLDEVLRDPSRNTGEYLTTFALTKRKES